MSIALTPSQTTWLEQQVAAGTFPSVESAVQQAVEQLIEDQMQDPSILKAMLDEARASLDRGEGIPWETVKAELHERRRRLAGLLK